MKVKWVSRYSYSQQVPLQRYWVSVHEEVLGKDPRKGADVRRANPEQGSRDGLEVESTISGQ